MPQKERRRRKAEIGGEERAVVKDDERELELELENFNTQGQ